MGLNDRDYLQSGHRTGRSGLRGSQGPLGIRGWTINTWLITICVAVFVVDAFLPPQFVFLGTVPVDIPPEATPEPIDRMNLVVPSPADGQVPRASGRAFLIPLLQKNDANSFHVFRQIYFMQFLYTPNFLDKKCIVFGQGLEFLNFSQGNRGQNEENRRKM